MSFSTDMCFCCPGIFNLCGQIIRYFTLSVGKTRTKVAKKTNDFQRVMKKLVELYKAPTFFFNVPENLSACTIHKTKLL